MQSRLIVAEMSEQRCDTIGWINLQLVLAVAISLYQPHFEIAVLYLFLIFVISAHVHYGVCVVSAIFFVNRLYFVVLKRL